MENPLMQAEQKPLSEQVWQLLIRQKGWQLLPKSWYPVRQAEQVLVPLHAIQLVTPQSNTQVPLEKVLLLAHVQTGVEELVPVVTVVPLGQLQVLLERTKVKKQVSHWLAELQVWQLLIVQLMQTLATESRVNRL